MPPPRRSGKTTLLNHILTSVSHGLRVAVIENEFGSVDIDGSLVAARASAEEDVLLLNNGCLCCSVRGDLVRMLTELVRSRGGALDHVVIETTGLANPAPIVQTFFLDPGLQETCRLDGVVTLVDAKFAALHLGEERAPGVVCEALEQVAFADRIVLNKTDLATEAELVALERRLGAVNKLATIRRAKRGVVDVDYVLGVGGFDLDRIAEAGGLGAAAAAAAAGEEAGAHGHSHAGAGGECGECGESAADGHSHGHGHGHGAEAAAAAEHAATEEGCAACESGEPGHSHGGAHGHSHLAAAAAGPPLHDDAVTSVSLVQAGELDIDAVNDWLGDLLAERWQDVYRLKGLLAVQGFPERYVMQGVHSIFEGGCERPWRAGEARTSRLVFIGRNLDEAELRAGLAACAARD